MSGWNRIFVVVAVVWALVAPFLLVTENNRPAERISAHAVTLRTNSTALAVRDSSTWINIEQRKAFVRNIVSVPGTFGAMIGAGDWRLAGVAWGFILIPLALLWIVGWGLGRVVHWIAAGFRR
jgi:hypothetical protein